LIKQLGKAARFALALAAIGCAAGVHLDTDPLASNPKAARIADLSMAIQRSPKDPKFYVERALAYENNGEYKTAIADIDTAITLRPNDQAYRFLRGIACAYAGDEGAAKADFERAEAMAPGSAESYNARAWLLATNPNPQGRDGKKAIADATRACEMTNWKNPEMLDTLAAAYAEAGDFQQAVNWQQKAIDLTSTTFLTTIDERRAWLATYQSRKPWRPTPPNHPIGPS